MIPILMFTTPSFWLLLGLFVFVNNHVSSRAFAFRNGVDFRKKCVNARSIVRKSISASTKSTATSTIKLSMVESSDNINNNNNNNNNNSNRNEDNAKFYDWFDDFVGYVSESFDDNEEEDSYGKIKNKDSNAFSMDAALLELMEEADIGQDILDEVSYDATGMTTIVEQPVMFSNPKDEQNGFDFGRWEQHRSPNRYFRLLFGLVYGSTTRRITPILVSLVLWTSLVDFYNSNESIYGLPEVELPLTPFELAAPVLGLLLVFRSNTAFERFNVGSDASWEITGRFRSIIRQLLSFTAPTKRFLPEERAAAYELVDACVVLHGWIMCDYLRSPNSNNGNNNSNSNDIDNDNNRRSLNKQAKILQKSLALPTEVAKQLRTNNNGLSSPATLIGTITLGIATRLQSLDPQEATMIEEQFSEVVSSLGTCEKLLRTPIPLGYTRYSVRFVMIWLTTLPFALVRTFAEFGTDTWWDNRYQPVLVVVMSFLSIVFLSIEDISVQIEEPFCVLPLDLHQQWLKRDLGQMKKTSRLVDVMLRQSTSTRSHHDSPTYDGKSSKKKGRRKWQRLALLRDRLLRQSPFHGNNNTNVLYGKHINILDEVSEIFHSIDTNGDGVITKDELRSHLVDKMGYTAEYADYLFASIDTDSSDDITKDEMKFAFYNFEALSMFMTFSMGGADITNSNAFKHLASKNSTGCRTEKLLLDDLADLIFDIIDTDKNGIISVDELKTYFESVTSKLKREGATEVESQTYVQTIFATLDANADGKICRDEIRAGFEKYDFKLLARSFGLRVIPHSDQANITS